MRKILSSIITALIISQTANAGTTSSGLGMAGVVGFGSLIAMSLHSECSEAAADLWDMEDSARTSSYNCVDVFKSFKDYSGLAVYRKSNGIASRGYSKLKQSLIASNVAAGNSGEPPDGCDAHHIVPEKEGRPWAKKFVEPSRKILVACNIDINSAENGVFLPRSESTKSECTGTFHRSMHDENYYTKVFTELDKAMNNGGGCSEVKNTLRLIKEDLINGAI